jgi:hypothetical protein
MIKVPGYTRVARKQKYRRPPDIKTKRPRKPPMNTGSPPIIVSDDRFNVGEGPWQLQGKPASKPEYRVGVILSKLGRRYEFQVSSFGGRLIKGGQMIDFLLEDRPPRTVIDVRGYYHKGAAGEAKDIKRRLQVLAADPYTRYVPIWEEDTIDETILRNKLSVEVGAGGR